MSNSILWALVAQTGIIVAGIVVILLFNHARFAALDKRIDGVENHIDGLESSLNRRIDDLRSEINARFSALQDLLRSEEAFGGASGPAGTSSCQTLKG